MRRLSSPTSPYTIQISSTAWGQISHLSAEEYRRIREELECLTMLPVPESAPLPASPTGEGGLHVALSAIIGDYVVLYEVNTFLKLVTVLELAHRLPR